MIIICVALIVLTLTIIILLLCMCRRCFCFKSQEKCKNNDVNDSYDIATSESCQESHYKTAVHHNHHRHLKLKTNNERKTMASMKKSLYSRNSSSSCSSTTATSSTSTSPKTNELTLYCDDENENQKMTLTIDASPLVNTTNSQSLSSNTNKNSFMLSSGSGTNHMTNGNGLDIMRNNLTTLTNLYNQNHYMNAMSSGSSSICASNAPLLHCNSSSANSTQSSSFLTSHLPNHQQPSLELNHMNNLDFDEQDETDVDFLVSTSSNLEFLKAHSLFNTTPLNYYPSLNLTKGASKLDLKMPLEDPPPYSDAPSQQQTISTMSNSTSNNNNNQASLTPHGSILNGSTTLSPKSSIFDYRFSTFLPPTFPKHHHELI